MRVAGISPLVLDTVQFKLENTKSDMKIFLKAKTTICNVDIIVMNIYVPNNIIITYTGQEL